MMSANLSCSSILLSPWNPPALLLINPRTLCPSISSLRSPTRRRRLVLRVSIPRCCSSSSAPPPGLAASPIFGDKKELSGVQALVDGLSPPVRLAGSALVLATAIAAGYGLGLRIGGTRNAALGTAAAMAAVGGAAVYAFNSCVPEVAAVNLHNFVVQEASYDPLALTTADIEAIATRFGISKQHQAFNAELCQLYFRYLSSVLPPGDESLKGSEVDSILKFKSALGIDDPEAANMHIELGRRIFRERLETGDRDADFQQLRAFQKLIYVSTLVFGEASTFLLPWKRVFNVTDAQVELAIRGNAQRLYSLKLNAVGRDLNVKQLTELKQYQLSYRLSDELAEDMFMVHIRKLVEENISTALDKLNSRASASGAKDSVLELDKIVVFNNLLLSLRNHPDASNLACGIGPISVVGGVYGDRRQDLKLLYRAYYADALSGGHIEENKLVALNELKYIFGLHQQEVEAIALDVTSKAYRRQLSQAVSSGALEAADSKAVFLQNLCDQLLFDPQKASEIHEEIYRQKLQQYIADKVLNEEEVASLLRLRVMLCIPQKAVEAIHAEICGSVFEKVVKNAVDIDGYDREDQASVIKAAHDLRLTRELAMSIASKPVRRLFMKFIEEFKVADSRSKSVDQLKQMIVFNRLVVTKLVADIKGESSDPMSTEPEKDEEPSSEEETWDSVLGKQKAPLKSVPITSMPGQTEITLRDDLPERERSDICRTFLLYCLAGDGSQKLVGANFLKEGDLKYDDLNQLSGILGMTEKETGDIQRTLGAQVFRREAESILADGQLTKPKIHYLEQVQVNTGSSPEYAQKVIKSITNSKVKAAVQATIRQGKLNIKQIRQLKEAGVDVVSKISLGYRENLFKKTVDEIFSSGTGEVDVQELYEKIPADLSIDADKAKVVVHERARMRLANSMIQAVAFLRQRNSAQVVSTLEDVLACDKVSPAEPLSWDVPQELSDLFATYMEIDQEPDKLSRLQYLLGINDATAAAIKEGVLNRGRELATEEEFVF